MHLAWCVKRNHNSSSAPGWSWLVAIVSALAPREFGGSSWVGRWNNCGLCAVLLCCCVMSVVVVVVVAVVLLSIFACACWCALSSKRPGARSRGRDASHRRQHCCASSEDRACCGVKLHLAPCRSWVGRWDDGSLGALLMLRCCELIVVAVVVAAVFLFLLVSMLACACWCARSSWRHGARSPVRDATHRRQHCCAKIEDRAYCGVTLHLAARRS